MKVIVNVEAHLTRESSSKPWLQFLFNSRYHPWSSCSRGIFFAKP